MKLSDLWWKKQDLTAQPKTDESGEAKLSKSWTYHTEFLIFLVLVVTLSSFLYLFQLNSGYSYASALYARTILSTGTLVSPPNLNSISYWFSQSGMGLEQLYPGASLSLAMLTEVTGIKLDALALVPFLASFFFLPVVWTRLFHIKLSVSVVFGVLFALSSLNSVTISRHTFGFYLLYFAVTLILIQAAGKGKPTSNLLVLSIFGIAIDFTHYSALLLLIAGTAAALLYAYVSMNVSLRRTWIRYLGLSLILDIFLFLFRNPILSLTYLNLNIRALSASITAYQYRLLHLLAEPTQTAHVPINNPLLTLQSLLGNLGLQFFLAFDLVIVVLSVVRYRNVVEQVAVTRNILAWFILGTALGDYISYGIFLIPGTIFYGLSIVGVVLFVPWITKSTGGPTFRMKMVATTLVLIIVSLSVVGVGANIGLVNQQGLNTVYPFELSQLTPASEFISNSSVVLWSSYGVSSSISFLLQDAILSHVVINPFEQYANNLSTDIGNLNSSQLVGLLSNNGYNGLLFYLPETTQITYGDVTGFSTHFTTITVTMQYGLDIVYQDGKSLIVIIPQ